MEPLDKQYSEEYEEMEWDVGGDDGDESSYPTYTIEPFNNLNPLNKKDGFVVCTVESIVERQLEKVSELMEMLGISQDEAMAVLRHFKWNLDKLQNEWFEKERSLRYKIGLDFDPEIPKKHPIVNGSLKNMNQGYCMICYEVFSQVDGNQKAISLGCGHQFCLGDWKEYLKARVNMSFQAVFTTCPQHLCNVMVPHSLFLKLLDPTDLKTYMKWSCKSYTDDNRNVRWCPFTGCDYCVEYQDMGLTDVLCQCGNWFCFKCGNESHKPVDCERTKQWMQKNSNESENITWILANTKCCPKCQKPIEKNQGCNHMTCKMCAYEFCWLCLGDWKEHGSSTGGYYQCNKYEELKKTNNGNIAQEEKKREDAKHELSRYMFYFERYINHEKAQKHAKTLKPVIQTKIELLQKIKKYPIQELDFLQEAISEIIRCRQVLKFTYVYGFYLNDQKEINLFQYLQEQLEKNCDYLHELVERPLDPYLDQKDTDRSKFYIFKGDLINYFEITRKVRFFPKILQFYENLLDGLEKGLTK